MLGALLITFLYAASSLGLDLPQCPYPLGEDIEPCVCNVDQEFRMILTCNLNIDFTEESFQKITEAFDYNNNIFSFDIEIHDSYNNNHYFYPQLDETNLGKLNITHFSLRKARLETNLFGEGAFSGSTGSITNITIESVLTGENATIDLGSHVLHPACPTLEYLNIEHVSQLSSTTLTLSPKLQEISFKQASFPILPSSLFSSQNVPNIQSITVGVSDDLNLQTDAFKDLEKLTNLDLSAADLNLQTDAFKDLEKLTTLELSATKIEVIQSYAFNNLPALKYLEVSGINIVSIEEDAFKDLDSLESIEITGSDMEHLPRIFSNSPSLTKVSITKSKLEMIEENAFFGVPSLEELYLDSNHELSGFSLHNMENVTKISLNHDYDLAFVNISNLPRLTTLGLYDNHKLSQVNLHDLPALAELRIDKDDQHTSLALSVSNCSNLASIDSSENNVVQLSLQNVDALTSLNLYSNSHLNHTGLGSSLRSIIDPDAVISLRRTYVRNLDEFVFRPLLETFVSAESSSGYIDMKDVNLDCGCDVKWLIMEFHFQTSYFKNARCMDGGLLADVDPILLEMMCPP